MTKILIVEDNEGHRDMLARRLRRHGFAVCVAADGPGGVNMATQQKPDLVLMDMGLGDMDGWEATAIMKANAQTAAIPVIALTAQAHEHARAMSLRVGCEEFETKPVDMSRLLDKINDCLAKTKGARRTNG